MALTADIQRAFVEGGAKTVMSRGIRKIVRPAFSMGSLVFTECDLTRPIPERQAVTGIIAREATIEDARLFEDRALFLKRFNQEHRCFLGIEQRSGKLTNYRRVGISAASGTFNFAGAHHSCSAGATPTSPNYEGCRRGPCGAVKKIDAAVKCHMSSCGMSNGLVLMTY